MTRKISCLAFTCAALLSACDADLIPYLINQGAHQGSLILRAKSVQDLLKRPDLDEKTESYLKLSVKVLDYAKNKLGMNTGRSYQSYISLDRDWVVQIVMAAEKNKLESHLFSYPIVGDLPYKGFYDESDAIDLEETLKKQGFDTYRRKVEAFSTTGWLPDPLISTMFSQRARFVELLFHELTHATFYFKSEADFNEAFASWMGYRGALEFLEANPEITDAKKIQSQLQGDDIFQAKLAGVVKEIVDKGKSYYAGKDPAAARESYFAWIKEKLSKDPDFKKLAAIPWNNAFILSLSTYYTYVGPINAYAEAHKLNPKSFLALVAKRGPSIIKEILQH